MTQQNNEHSQGKCADQAQYEDRLKFEHELINRRLTWLLTSQTILFAAYGFATGSGSGTEVFLLVTPIAGAVISGLIFIGVVCAILAKCVAWVKHGQEDLGVKTWITFVAFVPDLMLPAVFASAWIWIRLGPCWALGVSAGTLVVVAVGLGVGYKKATTMISRRLTSP